MRSPGPVDCQAERPRSVGARPCCPSLRAIRAVTDESSLPCAAVVPPPTSHDDPVALTAAVHEAVAGIEQALLWGMDVDDCRGLALDAFVELTASTLGAVGNRHRYRHRHTQHCSSISTVTRGSRRMPDRVPRRPPRDEFAALACLDVRRAMTARARR